MGSLAELGLIEHAKAIPLLPDVRPSRPPRDSSGDLFGKLVAVARRRAALRADPRFQEDEGKASEYSGGRYSPGYETCNVQELFFLETFLKAELLFQALRKNRKIAEDASLVEVVLNFGANLPKRPRQFADCRRALFHVLVAAERRGGIIYLPVDENSMIARYVQELADRGIEVQPSGAGDKPLPLFEVRCIGFSPSEMVAAE